MELTLFSCHLMSKYFKNESNLIKIWSFIQNKRPLESLQYLRICHDNSGKGEMASWFLKFIIVHDLQTREKSYFICNKWLALDKEDGSIDRILPISLSKQKNEFKYLFEKETKDKFRDGHLWLSLFTRPLHSSFTRTDRLTWCFALFYMIMLMKNMYYDLKIDNSSENVTSSFSKQQVNLFIDLNWIYKNF